MPSSSCRHSLLVNVFLVSVSYASPVWRIDTDLETSAGYDSDIHGGVDEFLVDAHEPGDSFVLLSPYVSGQFLNAGHILSLSYFTDLSQSQHHGFMQYHQADLSWFGTFPRENNLWRLSASGGGAAFWAGSPQSLLYWQAFARANAGLSWNDNWFTVRTTANFRSDQLLEASQENTTSLVSSALFGHAITKSLSLSYGYENRAYFTTPMQQVHLLSTQVGFTAGKWQAWLGAGGGLHFSGGEQAIAGNADLYASYLANQWLEIFVRSGAFRSQLPNHENSRWQVLSGISVTYSADTTRTVADPTQVASQQGKVVALGSGNFRFEYLAPGAKSVAIIGDFNNWDEQAGQLVPSGGGWFAREFSIRPGRWHYNLLIDGEIRVPPNAALVEPDGLGGRNGVLLVP